MNDHNLISPTFWNQNFLQIDRCLIHTSILLIWPTEARIMQTWYYFFLNGIERGSKEKKTPSFEYHLIFSLSLLCGLSIFHNFLEFIFLNILIQQFSQKRCYNKISNHAPPLYHDWLRSLNYHFINLVNFYIIEFSFI